jgi:hypothetical protein
MADGSSGLSLSEMGISTVKKTAQAVKKQATPFIQGVKQQLTGQTPKPQVPTMNQPSSQPPSEGIKSAVFDLFNPQKKQVSDSGNSNQNSQQQQQTQQNIVVPNAAQPPDEKGPAMSGTFDLSNKTAQNEQSVFETGNTSSNAPLNAKNLPFTSDIKKTAEQQDLEKQTQVEALRKKLHDAYYEEFEKKAEGKEQKEETAQEKLEREENEKQQKLMVEQEEEQKKAPIIPISIQGRQGAHEGLKQKG